MPGLERIIRVFPGCRDRLTGLRAFFGRLPGTLGLLLVLLGFIGLVCWEVEVFSFFRAALRRSAAARMVAFLLADALQQPVLSSGGSIYPSKRNLPFGKVAMCRWLPDLLTRLLLIEKRWYEGQVFVSLIKFFLINDIVVIYLHVALSF